MPVYIFRCACGVGGVERVLPLNAADPPCPRCEQIMTKEPTAPGMVRIKGQGYPARRKWMDNWTPESPKFSTGSEHGEKY